jgi:hypothetical protein
MESDLLKIILQIETLVDAAKGLPNNVVPDGVNPAPTGSSFDKKDIPPILSTNEISRVKKIAQIFKDIMMPSVEAERIKIKSNKDVDVKQNVRAAIDTGSLGKKDSKSGLLASLGGLSGALGSASSALPILASSLPILAGLLGVGGVVLAGGKAFEWILKGLEAAKNVNWKEVGGFATVITGCIERLADVYKDVLGFIIGIGGKIVEGVFDYWMKGINFLVETFGKFAGEVKKWQGIGWQELKVAGAAIAGFAALLAGIGNPPVAILTSIGNLILQWSNYNLSNFAANLGHLSNGLNQLLPVINNYKNLDLEGFGKALLAMFGSIGAINVAGLTAPLTALGSFSAKVASMGLDAMAATFGNVATGLEKLGAAQYVLADGIERLQELDPSKISALSKSVSDLGASLIGFGTGTVFSSFFKSSELENVIKFADKHQQLSSAAGHVKNIAEAFKAWTSLPLDDLSYNLKEIQETIDKMNVSKLERAFKATMSVRFFDTNTKQIYNYMVSGKDTSDTGNGLISITRDILDENKKLNNTATKIRDILVRIEEKGVSNVRIEATNRTQPGSPLLNMYNSDDRRRPTQTNPRDLFKSFTL